MYASVAQPQAQPQAPQPAQPPAQQPVQPPVQPLPEPEQPSSAQLDADPNVQSAIRFLQDARVKSSPIESQIRFLKGKNMSDAQIKHAMTKVGRAATAEKIASVRAPPPMSGSFAGQPAANTVAMSAQLNSRPQSLNAAVHQPQYSQTLFPRSPPPPQEEPQPKGVDWRDVVIGTGAALLAGISGYKLFNRYSPYEIRRKSEKKASRGSRGRQPLPLDASSESETDGSAYRSHRRAAPLPPPPTNASPAMEPGVVAAAPGADAEEVKKLQTQLDETKEALTNERKKCADLAVGAAKIRAEKQQLSRANDRLTQQVDALKKDVERLEAEKAPASGEAALTATDEEPSKPFYPSLTVEGEQARASAALSPVSAALPNNAAPAATSPAAAPFVNLAETAMAATAAASAAAASAPAAPAAPAPLAPLAPLTTEQPAVTEAPVPAPAAPAPLAPPAPLAAEQPAAPIAAALPAAPLATPPAAPSPAPLPAVDAAPSPVAAAPAGVASVVPPAFLTPEPIKPEEAAAAPTN